jgi:surface protein
MERMFYDCKVFDQPLENWKTENVSNMEKLFTGCSQFNSSVANWNTRSVITTQEMFSGCVRFNQPIEQWDMQNVINTAYMFTGCAKFNQPLNEWEFTTLTDTDGMFAGCTIFNQPLDKWDVSIVSSMTDMFAMCRAFNQNLTGWEIDDDAETTDMFINSGMAPENIPELVRADYEEDDSSEQYIEYATAEFAKLDRYDTKSLIVSPESKAYDVIEMDDVSVLDHLKASMNNVAFYFNKTFYITDKARLKILCHDVNFVKYRCHDVYNILQVTPDKYDGKTPYLLGNSFGCPCGLLEISKLKTIIETNSIEFQCFVILPFEPAMNAPSTVSLQMLGPNPNASGASHCQEGQGETICNIQRTSYTYDIKLANVNYRKLAAFLHSRVGDMPDIQSAEPILYILSGIFQIIKTSPNTTPQQKEKQKQDLLDIAKDGLQRIKSHHLTESIINAIAFSVKYVFMQPPVFKDAYVHAFLYGRMGGSMERLIMSLAPACVAMKTMVADQNPDYNSLLNIVNEAGMINKYVSMWYREHKRGGPGEFPAGTTEDEKRESLRAYLTKQFADDPALVEKIIAKYGTKPGFSANAFIYGGKRGRKPASKKSKK